MVPASEAAERILEIEALQDEVLRQLEALEHRIEEVLAAHLGTTAAGEQPDAKAA